MNIPRDGGPAGRADAGDPWRAERAWADAALAAAMLAVDPHGLGGAVLRAGAGPVRDRWLADLRALLPAAEPLRRMPHGIADERLLGGLDLTATLHAGRPVAQRGLLAECDGGLVVMPMAERLPAGTAARLAGVLDRGEVGFERDGLSQRWPAHVGLVACDEGQDDDAPLASTLVDRLAFVIDLRPLSQRDGGEAGATPAAITAARALLPQVTVPEPLVQALCGTALQIGVPALRASLLAVRATRVAAALQGRTQAIEDDAVLAGRLVLGPRATVIPMPDDAQEAEPEPADPPPEPHQPPEPPPPEHTGDDTPPPPPPPPPADEDAPPADPAEVRTLDDRLIEAALAALPPGLLALLQGIGQPGRQPGRMGALATSPRHGRPAGTRRGLPRGGARLNLIETLRAAAPWQRVRAAATAPSPRPARLHIHADDLRIQRLQQHAATATIFVIDASGSSALNRLAEAKGAVNLLLADCYVRRDQVAVVAFRGTAAEVLLPPTRSLVRARRSLAALPGGGGTPLASGIEAAMQVAAQVRRAGATPVIVLLTDGRANIARNGDPGRTQAEADALAMARRLRAAQVTTLLVDTSPKPAPAAQRLALEMAAHYRALPHAGAHALSAAVQALPRGGRPAAQTSARSGQSATSATSAPSAPLAPSAPSATSATSAGR